MSVFKAAIFLENTERANSIAQILHRNDCEALLAQNLSELSSLIKKEIIDVAVIKFENDKKILGNNIRILKDSLFSVSTQILFDVEDRNSIKANDIIFFGKDSLVFNLDETEILSKLFNLSQKSKKIRNKIQEIEEAYSESKNKKILIIDNDNNFITNLYYILQAKSFDIAVAKDFDAAKLEIANSKFKIIFSAYNVNQKNALDFWREIIKSDNKIKKIPLVLIFNEGEEHEIIFGYDLNIQDYIIKNYATESIKAKIENIIQKNFDERKKILATAYENYLNNVATYNQNLSSKIFDLKIINKIYSPLPGGEFFLTKIIDDNLVFILADIMGKKWSSWHNAKFYADYFYRIIYSMLEIKKFDSTGILTEEINKFICEDAKISEVFPSCLISFFNFKNKKMQLSIAGDFTAIIVDKQKEIDMPSDKGLLLGLTEETSYETYESKILSGNSYFFLSDGCLEARNLQGNSINLTKILTIVASNQNNDELLNNLTKLYESFSSQYLEDDITIANLFINNL